jgi:hypothetical protein
VEIRATKILKGVGTLPSRGGEEENQSAIMNTDNLLNSYNSSIHLNAELIN